MKIGVDAATLSRQPTGIANTILALLEPLMRRRPEVEWLLFAPNRSPTLDRLLAYPNTRVVPVMRAWRHPVDVYWAANQLIHPLVRAKRTVVTVYDFNYLLCPETMTTRGRLARRLLAARSIRRADTVITISHGTAARMEEHYGRRADAVIPPAVRDLFRPGKGSRSYALSVATLEPRKNLGRLVDGYLMALEQHGSSACMPLVLVGGRGWKDQPLLRTLQAAMARYPDQIRLTGYVADEQLLDYFIGARAFFLVSRYEGYGMPIAEARACGTPVVCSDTPEMREAAQEDGLFLPLDQLEQRLAPLFCKDSPQRSVGAASYPTPEELAMQMERHLV